MLLWRGDVLYNTVAGNIFWVWVQILLTYNSGIHLVKMLGHINWQAVGGHDAVLFVPEDLTKIGFWDLYVRAMPLFMPSAYLTAIILCPEQNSRIKMHYFEPRRHLKELNERRNMAFKRLELLEARAIEDPVALPKNRSRFEPFDLEFFCHESLRSSPFSVQKPLSYQIELNHAFPSRFNSYKLLRSC